LESIADCQAESQNNQNQLTGTPINQPATSNVAGVVSVTGQLTQNQSIITDITNHHAENLMLYMHDRGYLHLFNGDARPNSRVTRGDFAYMFGSFVRANNSLLNSHGFTTSRRNSVSFSDINSRHFAYQNLIELARRRIIHDTGANIRPDAYITRDEADRWLHNLFYLMDDRTTRAYINNPRGNLTRIEAAEMITQIELILNNGPVMNHGGLNLIRANARNFTPHGFELHLTVNNASIWSGASVSYRIEAETIAVPLSNLTPIATFAHNSVYSLFVPAEFPGTHTVFVNLTLGNTSSPVRVVTAHAVAGPSNFIHQTENINNNWNNQNLNNNWNWNNNNNWNNNWNWNNNNNWNSNWNWNNQGDQWSQPNHQFPGWNTPGNNWSGSSGTNNITFGDSRIEAEVRRQLNISSGNITAADARRITEISITIPSDHFVSSNALRGLEYFTNLRYLRFSFTGTNTSSNLRNLRDLESLTDLRIIELRGHGINNLSHIVSLRRLETLDLNMTDSIMDSNRDYINYLNRNHNLTTWR